MALRMEKIEGMARGRFYLALAYLIWTILPHFHVLFHSHAGGAHFHATFTPTQVRMANRVLDGLGPSALATAQEADVGGEAAQAASADPLAEAATAWAPGAAALSAGAAGSGLHGHYWEDANLAGILGLFFAALIATRYFSRSFSRAEAPDARPMGFRLARGPPLPFPA
jgi:hypothetical protein